MKKFRLILAAVTAAEGIYMIYANWSVRGYHLLEMNAAAGHRAAVTYRWAVVLFLILLGADIAAGILSGRRIHKKNICPVCKGRRREQGQGSAGTAATLFCQNRDRISFPALFMNFP